MSNNFCFSRFKMGTNRNVHSLMDDPAIRAKATVWLRLNAKRKKKATPNMKIKDFQRYLQDDLLADTDKIVTRWFAHTMLMSLGWCFKRHSKGIYYDGHERPDVVAARKEFLRLMSIWEKRMKKYSGPECTVVTEPALEPGQREIVLVVHDECTVYAYEDETHSWVEKGRGHQLKNKAKGPTINLSFFLSELGGLLKCTDDQYAAYKISNPDSDMPQDAGVKMKSGAAHATAKTGKQVLGIDHNGYWTSQHVLAQCRNAVRVFEVKHPGKVGLFLFDNSTGHNAFAEDALIAHHMGYRPGGNQPHLRPGTWEGKPHPMDFVIGDQVLHAFNLKIGDETHSFAKGLRVRRGSKLINVQKGSRQVCMERSIPVKRTRPGGKKEYIKHCCKKESKTEAELFQDEMLKAAGKMDQVLCMHVVLSHNN